jgi:DNA repair protein RadC
MQAAILPNASQIALCYNYPAGNLKPSVQDDRLTKRVKEACDIFDISLIDHLVISSESYYSFF